MGAAEEQRQQPAATASSEGVVRSVQTTVPEPMVDRSPRAEVPYGDALLDVLGHPTAASEEKDMEQQTAAADSESVEQRAAAADSEGVVRTGQEMVVLETAGDDRATMEREMATEMVKRATTSTKIWEGKKGEPKHSSTRSEELQRLRAWAEEETAKKNKGGVEMAAAAEWQQHVERARKESTLQREREVAEEKATAGDRRVRRESGVRTETEQE